MTKISVVIPTYNRLETLKWVLDGFNAQTLPTSQFEVILVDSMSNDGTREYAESFQALFPFRYIRQENKGRPGARNRGIREAKSDLVFFTDSDIIPERDLLEKHLAFHDNHVKAAAVGWEARINSFDELESARQNAATRFRLHSPQRKKLHWLYFLTGNASVPKQYLLEAGLFDEAFQGYGFEDLELGYRLVQRGVSIVYLSEAVNYHLHPRTLEAKAETQRLAGRNAVRFYRKHGDWRIRWLLGMSPPAFFWHSLIKRMPWFLRFLKNRSNQEGGFAQAIFSQVEYLNGVKESWIQKR